MKRQQNFAFSALVAAILLSLAGCSGMLQQVRNTAIIGHSIDDSK